MRVGFASIYAWRPHVEHLHFLATLAQRGGASCHFLTCDGDLPACYTRELRSVRPDWQECLACRAGGLRSYSGQAVSSLGAMARAAEASATTHGLAWASSSASTLGRFETDADYNSPAFAQLAQRLAPAVEKTYAATRAWIARERLDAVCVFNGRMDAPRAVFEAARDAGIRALSVERSWFGDGLQLLPDENCLGLRSVDSLVRTWRDKPLTRAQALKAASYAAARFLRRNQTEWRAYNTQAQAQPWPVVGGKHRLLLLPSSRNEFWGHPDWSSNWAEPTAVYDALMQHLGLEPRDLLLRCHPNWGEKIGKNDGRLPENYFTGWARQRGVQVIPSTDPCSTLGLIEQCDAIVVSSGSAALEAGLLGRQVIATDPSIYQQAGLRSDCTSPATLAALQLDASLPEAARMDLQHSRARQTLRFAYTMTQRVPQFTRFVRARSAADYDYLQGADPRQLLELLASGSLQADDTQQADHPMEEEAVLDLIGARAWAQILEAATPDQSRPPDSIGRRWMFRPLDMVRRHMRMGDR